MGAAALTRGQRRLSLRIVLLGSDLLMLSLATVAASLIRFGRFRHVEAAPDLVLGVQFADLSLIIVLIAIAAMWYEGLYDMDRVFWGTGEYSRVARGQSLAVVAFILATYVLKLPGLSRGWLMLVWGLGILFVVIGRVIVRTLLSAARRRRRLLRPTLMVGYNEEAIELIHRLQSDTSSGLDPTACLASTLQDMHDLQSGPHEGPDVSRSGAQHQGGPRPARLRHGRDRLDRVQLRRAGPHHRRPARPRRGHRDLLRAARRDHIQGAHQGGLGRSAHHRSRRVLLGGKAVRQAHLRPRGRRAHHRRRDPGLDGARAGHQARQSGTGALSPDPDRARRSSRSRCTSSGR